MSWGIIIIINNNLLAPTTCRSFPNTNQICTLGGYDFTSVLFLRVYSPKYKILQKKSKSMSRKHDKHPNGVCLQPGNIRF